MEEAKKFVPISLYELDAPLPYEKLTKNLEVVRKTLKRPMNLAEKVLYAHLLDPTVDIESAIYLDIQVDRAAMQDATGQMALLQHLSGNLGSVKVPTTIHCDHLFEFSDGADMDLENGKKKNQMVYEFIKEVSNAIGVGYWEIGSGIIHQVLLENYAFPGGFMIGSDSHTPNAGGLGMIAIGVGGADVVDAMAGIKWEIPKPKILGIELTGELKGFARPKDIPLTLLKQLGTTACVNKVIEYYGTGVKTLSTTGMATVANVGAELGATSSIFPYNEEMGIFLEKTGRGLIAEECKKYVDFLIPDEGCKYDEVIKLDLSTVIPQLAGPSSPANGKSVKEIKELAERQGASSLGFPLDIAYCLVGSCTNSSFEDLRGVRSIVEQAEKLKLKPKVDMILTIGSERIKQTIIADGTLDVFKAAGVKVGANGCGPCIGKWNRGGSKGLNTIVTSYNRNFDARNDKNKLTKAFLASPEMVAIACYSGRLDFDPETDTLTNLLGKEVKFEYPEAIKYPKEYSKFNTGYYPPKGGECGYRFNPLSQRIAKFKPFEPWNGEDVVDARVLVRLGDHVTTDHISPGGSYLNFRGHLDNISENLFEKAEIVSDNIPRKVKETYGDGQPVGVTWSPFEPVGHWQKVSTVARSYKAHELPFVVVAGDSYGEGSSREHAALEPRYFGCRAIFAKGFQRIHKTNLQKQGVLTFQIDDEIYRKFQMSHYVSIFGLNDMMTSDTVTVRLDKRDAKGDIVPEESFEFKIKHGYDKDRYLWFVYGSALNYATWEKRPQHKKY